jgi:predicted TIM-barrel fold metal-dependent hydrolase
MSEKVVIISCDTHIGPRLREDLRQYCPKKYLDDYDAFVTYFEEQNGGRDDAPYSTKGHYDVHARLADLDQDGTAGEVIFHGSQNAHPIPFVISDASTGMLTMDRHYDVDYEHAAVGRHMYNQWLADFCSVQPERHVGLAHLPMWNIDDAIKEATWAREHGLKGINFPAEAGEDQFSKSRWAGKFKYHAPEWEPFWAAVNDLDMPFCTHGGAGDPDNLPGGYPTWLYETNELTRRPIHRLLFAGVFERYKNLRIVVTEQPGLWFKTKMDDLDSLQWMANLPRKPSEYIRDHVFLGASFMSRFEAEDAINNDYWQNCIWGTDYPHIEGVWKHLDDKDAEPHSHMGIRFAFAGLDPEKVKTILGLTGARVYGFDTDALHKIAQTINAPTIEQINRPLESVPEGAGMWAFRNVGAFA